MLRLGSTKGLCTVAILTLTLAACANDDKGTDGNYEKTVVSGMHEALLTEIEALQKAAEDLQQAAPAPQGRGWDANEDAAALDKMRAAWVDARTAYEHIEGALAPLFPTIDFAIDARYDDFLTELGPDGDDDAFDAKGVTGMHAIERILWAESIPARVIEFEASLPGYRPAALPATEEEAATFKSGVAAQFVKDVKTLHDQWKPQKIDVAGAFQGLIALMNEQQEKVNKAASNEEESRYSQRTMVDIRDNLDGTVPIYELFQAWLRSKGEGTKIDKKIETGFGELTVAYRDVKGDAIPTPPATWRAEDPSDGDLDTDFGKLYRSVKSAVDPSETGSVVQQMNAAANVLGFPEFTEE